MTSSTYLLCFQNFEMEGRGIVSIDRKICWSGIESRRINAINHRVPLTIRDRDNPLKIANLFHFSD